MHMLMDITYAFWGISSENRENSQMLPDTLPITL